MNDNNPLTAPLNNPNPLNPATPPASPPVNTPAPGGTAKDQAVTLPPPTALAPKTPPSNISPSTSTARVDQPPKGMQDIQSALNNLDRVEKYLLGFKGKQGYNPYFFIHNTIEPLRSKLKTQPVTDAVITEALALKDDEQNAKPPSMETPASILDLTKRGF